MTPSKGTAKPPVQGVLDRLAKLLGSDRVVVAAQRTAAASATVAPRTPSEVATIFECAAAGGVPVRVLGGRASARRDGKMPLVLDASRLDHLLDLDLSSRIVSVQTGMKVGALEQRLAKEGLSVTGSAEDERLLLHALCSERSEDVLLQQACIGMSAVLPTGAQVHVRPSPRRATGPDLMSLLLGKGIRFGLVVTVTLRLIVRRAPIASAVPAQMNQRPPKKLLELLDALSRKLDPSGILS